jgi:hypothetical protein
VIGVCLLDIWASEVGLYIMVKRREENKSEKMREVFVMFGAFSTPLYIVPTFLSGL